MWEKFKLILRDTDLRRKFLYLLGFLAVLYASPALSSFFADIPFLPTDVPALLALLGIILGGELLLAIFLGAIGSLVAMKRYLKI